MDQRIAYIPLLTKAIGCRISCFINLRPLYISGQSTTTSS